MKIDKQSVDKLLKAPYNPRKELKPGDVEYTKLKNSIEKFGYVEPIIVNDRTGYIVGGHQRLSVLKDLGYTEVEVVHVDLDDAHEKALNIALNKVSGDWDADKLEDLLRDININSDLDIKFTGFDLDELETMFNGALESLGGDDEDDDDVIILDKEECKGNLARNFGGIPPFSILDTTKKQWLDRKKYWLDLGIRSEIGRDAPCISNAGLDKFGANGKAHTSIFDPLLCELMYTWFNLPNGSILDPFAGGSVRGIVADIKGYNYTGIELRKEQVDANINNANEIGCNPTWICDDSNNMDNHIEDNSVDMVFTCPPYADLEVYSDDDRDLSNKNYNEFIKLYTNILSKACNKLKNNRFLVIVISEVRNKKDGTYYGFVPDTINILKNCGLTYYNELILKNSIGTLHLRVSKQMNSTRKIGRMHQNILVFYKGDIKSIKSEFGVVEVSSEEDIVTDEE